MANEAGINDKIGTLCKRLIEAAKKSRKSFITQGREIMRYGFSPEHHFEYQSLAPAAFFKAKVAKTSEAIQIFVPLLWHESPERQLDARPWMPPYKQQRLQVRTDYLNYIVGENGHADASRRALIDSICFGEGVRWTGRHPDKNIIYSAYDSINNLLKDPNAHVPEDIQWKSRRRCRPRFMVIADHPDIADKIKKLPASSRRESDSVEYQYNPAINNESTTDCITYYEMYFKVGVHNFNGGYDILKEQRSMAGGQPEDFQADNSPKKYLIHETGAFMKEEPWEVPFYLGGMWPCEELAYWGDNGTVWSTSPLQSGIGYQRGMNWIVTLLMGKYRFTSKTMLAVKKQNGQGLKDADIDKVLVGADIDAIQVDIKGEKKSLKDFIEKFEYDNSYIQAGLTLLEALETRFEKATGLYDAFYAEQGDTQDRSAEATRFREKNTNLRIGDMQSAVSNWESRLAKKEDFAANFLMQRQDIAQVMGDQAAQAWGYLVPEGQDTPQAIYQGLVQQAIQSHQMIPPQVLQQQAMQTAGQVYTLSSISNDADYSVESASGKRKDAATRMAALNDMMNQTVPTQLQSPDPMEHAIAYQTMVEYYKELGCSDDLIAAYKQMVQHFQMLAMGPPPGAPPPGNGPPGHGPPPQHGPPRPPPQRTPPRPR